MQFSPSGLVRRCGVDFSGVFLGQAVGFILLSRHPMHDNNTRQGVSLAKVSPCVCTVITPLDHCN